MGTITRRPRKDGTAAYTAQIRIKRAGTIVHSEAQTFERKAAAQAWLKKREAELDQPGALERLKAPDPTLGEAIDRYVAEVQHEVGRTKAQVLRTIRRNPISELPCSQVTSDRLLEFARSLGTTPTTTGNYLSHLAAIFAIAKPAWGFPLDRRAMEDARAVANRMGVVTRSFQRSRRPTIEEMDRIMAFFEERRLRDPRVKPMAHIVAFALFSTRRLEEICRIRWEDYQPEHGRVLVRDMKDPGRKVGNHVWCDVPEPAMRVIALMPRHKPEIFPYGPDGTSVSFTNTMHVLGIEDLHFHDLRHEGISRLFEMGLNIPHVASVSGHRSWVSLKRYTHLRETGDRWAGWPWLDRLAPVLARPVKGWNGMRRDLLPGEP